jgi:hypothetical protein
MCINDSTSVEHAPPKCFFPKEMRTNLITVPSCPIHNEETSKDDEYARNVITMCIENNQTSNNHFLDKSLSSFKRSIGLAMPILVSLKDASFYKLNAMSFQIDRPRFDRIIRKIAYALFFREYGYTWEKLITPSTNQIKMSNMENDYLGVIFETFLDEFDTLKFKGENPLVFKYAFINSDVGKYDKVLFMIFYEGFPFCVLPDAKSDHCSFD